jgi:Lipid-binding putative hydrolase
MKRIISIATIIFLVFISSCSKNLPDVGGTAAVTVANEWWVTFKLGDQDLIGTHVKIATYNTSDNKDSIWVDDLQNTWSFKVKAKADYKALTFETNNAQNEYYDIQVKITNGKILHQAGKSRVGNITDSIYLEATFTDDPDNKYILSGTARTMYAEDDY